MTKPRVFLSYSNRDAKLAGQIEAALERLGVEAFNPARAVRPGEDWRKSVQAGIKRSDAVVILAVAPHSLSSTWTAYEAGVAEALGKRVVLLLPSKYPAAELPPDFASTQIVELDPTAPERTADDIVSLWRDAA